MAELYCYDKKVDEFEKDIIKTLAEKFIDNLMGDSDNSKIEFDPIGKFIIEVNDAEEKLIKKIEITPLLRHEHKIHDEVDFGTEKGKYKKDWIKKVITFDKIYNIKEYEKLVEGNEEALRTELEKVFPKYQGEEYTDEDESKGLISFSGYYKSIGIKVVTTSPIEIEE